MKHTLQEAIVEALSFSVQSKEALPRLAEFPEREWKRILPWLDDTGLSLYFVNNLEASGGADHIPPSALAYLETNLNANRGRVAYMEQQFVSLNRRFNEAGLKYAAVKGLALVPEFCPDPSLRPLNDLDYLIDDASISAAERIIESAGYALSERKGPEAVFVTASSRVAVSGPAQFRANAPHCVELHRAMWDSESVRLSFDEPRFLDRAVEREPRGSRFFALREEDSFLLQTIHIFSHILTAWVRMSWLYELGYSLSRRRNDVALWHRIAEIVGDNLTLRETAVIAAEMAANLFQAPMPPPIKNWSEELRPPLRVWLDHYARRWLFGRNQLHEPGFVPTCALPIFLHQQYAADTDARRRLVIHHLVPTRRISRIAQAVKSKPSTAAKGDFRKRQHILRRLFFRLAAAGSYFWELPRWRRRNGSFARRAAHSRLSGPDLSSYKDVRRTS